MEEPIFVKNTKIEESIKKIRNLNNKILSFRDNTFEEKKDTFITHLKVEYDFEKNFLEQIYLLEEKLLLNFRPSNWPRGYRFESRFEADVVFDVEKEGFKEYKTYYRITILEDILEMKRHRVFFQFKNFSSEGEFSLLEVFTKMGEKIILDDTSINGELSLLATLSTEELYIIGTLFREDEIELSKCNEKNKNDIVCDSINPYIKLLKSKHDFVLLRKMESENYSLVEGELYFESMFILGAVFREIDKYSLRIRIFNRDINKIYFVFGVYVYTLTNILNYAGVENLENKNEFEHLINFSNYDLNIIALLINDMVKNKFIS